MMKTFPELARPPHERITKINEMMKSADAKKHWREFMERSARAFCSRCNFGSLILKEARDGYGEIYMIFGVSLYLFSLPFVSYMMCVAFCMIVYFLS